MAELGNDERPSGGLLMTAGGAGPARCSVPPYRSFTGSGDVGCFRYSTPAVHGKWMRSECEARSDALRAGVAYLREGRITLFEFTVIEEMPASSADLLAAR